MSAYIGGLSFNLLDIPTANSSTITINNTATNGDIIVITGSNNDDSKVLLKNNQVSDNILQSVESNGHVALRNTLIEYTDIQSYNTTSTQAYTAANVLNGIITRDCNGADRTDTLPTAASIIALIPNAFPGNTFTTLIRNVSTTHTLTIDESGSGISIEDDKVVISGQAIFFTFLVTNVAPPLITGYVRSRPKIVPGGSGSSLVNTYSLNFSASNQHYRKLSLPGSFPLNMSNAGYGPAWSVSYWYKRTVSSLGNVTIFGASVDFSTFPDPVLFSMINNGSPYLFLGTVYNAPSGLLVLTCTTSNLFVQDAWTHVLITYDGGVIGGASSTAAVYGAHFKIIVNGVSQSFSSTAPYDGIYGQITYNDFSLGTSWMALSSPDSGHLDEVAIFDADVSSDVSNIYNGGDPEVLTNLSTPPLHWWRFTQTDSTNYPTLADHIGSIDLTGTNLSSGNITAVVPP